MSYDHENPDGERHLATSQQLKQSAVSTHDADSANSHDLADLDHLFEGGPDLETREGVERALGRPVANIHTERL